MTSATSSIMAQTDGGLTLPGPGTMRRQLSAAGGSVMSAGAGSAAADVEGSSLVYPGNSSVSGGAYSRHASKLVEETNKSGAKMTMKMKWAAGDANFSRLAQKEIEKLTAVSAATSTNIIRSVSYGQKQMLSAIEIEARVAKAIQPRSAAVAPLEELPKLDRALARGPEADQSRTVLYRRKRLIAGDLASTLLRRDRLSGEWVDKQGLGDLLDTEPINMDSDEDDVPWTPSERSAPSMPARKASSTGALPGYDATSRRPSGGSTTMEGSSSGLDRKISGAGSPVSTAREKRMRGLSAARWQNATRDHPVLRRRRWPSIAKFENYWDVPEDEIPPKPVTLVPEPVPLPPAKKTIASIEESTSHGAQAYLWPALAQFAEPPEEIRLIQEAEAAKPANVFKGSVVYRQACLQLSVPVLSPRPVFGESVELRDVLMDSTFQCYAVAAAVRASAPKELRLANAQMTDIGGARIVEAGLRGGRLEGLSIVASCINYKTCTALHECLRMRGSKLASLQISQCGVGEDLDINVDDLTGLFQQAYRRSTEAFERIAERIEAEEANLHAELSSEDEAAFLESLPPSMRALSKHSKSGSKAPSKRPSKAPGAKGGSSSRSPSKSRPPSRLPSRALSRAGGSRAPSKQRASSKGPSGKDGKVSRQTSKKRTVQMGDAEKGDEAKAQEEEEEPIVLTPLLNPVLMLFAEASSSIQHLNLSRTLLSVKSTQSLSRMLATSPVVVLNLSECGIDDAGLVTLSQGLLRNKNLLEVHLRCNDFGREQEPMTSLLEAAGRHIRLAHLDISENVLPRECVRALCNLMRWSFSLVALHILGAGSGPAARDILNAIRQWTKDCAEDPMLKDVGEASVFSPQTVLDEEDENLMNYIDDEVMICRALHVRGLSDWRVVSPPEEEDPSAPVMNEHDPKMADRPVPQSWMPPTCWVCARAAATELSWCVPDRGEGVDTAEQHAKVFVRPSFTSFSRIECIRQRVVGSGRVTYNAHVLVPPGQHYMIFESEVGEKVQLLCSQDLPSLHASEANLTEEQMDEWNNLCRKKRYPGKINLLALVTGDCFQISEQQLEPAKLELPQTDPWVDDPLRQERLRQCYERDLDAWHLSDLCHADEEMEVKDVLWDLYPRLYENYAIFAGRSQWPYVRQVDVYSFFEAAQLLQRGAPSSSEGQMSPTAAAAQSPAVKAEVAAAAAAVADGTPAESTPELSPSHAAVAAMMQKPLTMQDVQQILQQTVVPNRFPPRSADDGRRGSRSRMAASIKQRMALGAPLTRPQFIEVLLRTANALRGQTEKSTARAFRRFVDKIISAKIMQAPLAPFPRGVHLQVGEVCDILLSRRKIIKEAWERYGGSENSFQRLAQILKLCDRNFNAKHMASIFALARRPQEDCRLENKKDQSLAYDEFCEALSRIALIWKRGSNLLTPDVPHTWPPQPKVGQSVRQRPVARRLETFIEFLQQRMRPAVSSSSF
eukprot:TRINITY_DN27099_c0_g1_i1.p1 TRINITY_DN27099_c0_g1~~TRINITY_DN27099_c0_g1_i1.p1  ORF type:complete len:1464 (-),score=380.45 TRINITY_DN27099_c0_g1_i1:227-4618(-)